MRLKIGSTLSSFKSTKSFVPERIDTIPEVPVKEIASTPKVSNPCRTGNMHKRSFANKFAFMGAC